MYHYFMPYLIDGHNLIPKFGISLGAEDDEDQLMQILNTYARFTRKGQMEIYFDKAATGTIERKIPSFLKVHFVKTGKTADEAIINRARSLDKAVRNWIVVSSDRYVQRECRNMGASVVTSDQFVSQVRAELAKPHTEPNMDEKLSEAEVDAWMDLFNKNNPRP